MFVPESSQVPVPFLVRVPVEVPIIPDIVPVPTPASVNPKAPATVPLQVNVPEAVAVIVDAAPNVIFPANDAAVEVLVNAPAGDAVKPDPFMVKTSFVSMEYPFKSKTAPSATVVPPASLLPNGPLSVTLLATPMPNFNVPALIVVVPL